MITSYHLKQPRYCKSYDRYYTICLQAEVVHLSAFFAKAGEIYPNTPNVCFWLWNTKLQKRYQNKVKIFLLCDNDLYDKK